MILYFRVSWDHINGTPFITKMIPINSQLGYITLVNYTREEIVNNCPSTEYDDEDIHSVKYRAVAESTCMLPVTASIYIDTIKNDDPKQLNVAIHRSIQLKPVQDVFTQMMADTRPTTMKYNSKWSVNDVVSFQVGYEAAANKGDNHQNDKISYVPLDSVADYVYIADLNNRLRVCWKILPNLSFKLKFQN